MSFRSTEGSRQNVRGCPKGELDGDEFNDLMTSRPTRSTIQGTRDTKDGGFEAMIGWLLERGLPLTASVGGYCGHGEGVEDEHLFVVLSVVVSVSVSVSATPGALS